MQIRVFLWTFWLLLTAVSLLALPPALARAQSPEPAASGPTELIYDEAEAHAINRMIMCPVCPAETIDQAQVPIARQMRQIVQEKLAEGATREEILDFFAQRYGPDILAAPPKSGFNLLAWIFPVVGVAAALLAGMLVLRSMRARSAEETATGSPGHSVDDEELTDYLELVDRELALDQPDKEDTSRNASVQTPST